MLVSLDKIRDLNRSIGLGRYGEVSVSRYQIALNYIADHVESGDQVCEIGPGGVISYVAKYSEATASAVVNPKEHHWDKLFSPYGIELIRWDVNTKLKDSVFEDRFDCIVFLETLEHLNRWPEQVISDIYKLLKPNGVLLLSTPNLVRASNRIRMLFGRSPADPFKYTPKGEHHVREYTVKELITLFPKPQWKIERVSMEVRSRPSRFSIIHLMNRFLPSLFGTIIFLKARKSPYENV